MFLHFVVCRMGRRCRILDVGALDSAGGSAGDSWGDLELITKPLWASILPFQSSDEKNRAKISTKLSKMFSGLCKCVIYPLPVQGPAQRERNEQHTGDNSELSIINYLLIMDYFSYSFSYNFQKNPKISGLS